MGLMLSVLVFCVGVVEVLDCWHHFLLHLVQPQYNPLPFPLDPHRDILCEKELYPSSDSRRPSYVDISWPKDLSPTDDLHVIRKRVHSENERSFVTDGCTNSSPQIVVCGPDPDDNDRDQCSPTGSWNTSPNHLELGVITESDSSSEVDEPSQIENLAYKKDCTPNYSQSFLKKDDRANELPHDSTDEKRADDLDWESDEEGNPDWSFTENDSEIKSGIEKDIYDKQSAKNVPEVSVLPDLPVFTDNILSTNVTKVSGRYPSENMSSYPLCIEETSKSVFTSDELTDSNDIKLSSLTKDNISNPLTNYEYSTSSENQSISSILDEGLEPIPEFPEMRLLGKSPLRPEQSSDSSLNTSDASLLVKSKTSDRPLVIRVSPSRCLQQEADTVISTELEAVENKTGSGINEKLPKVDDVKGIDINEHYLDDFRRLTDYQKSLEGMQSQSTVYPEITGECATDEKISIQPDTNSSSSSLSGIPQLPEDSKDAALRPFLPTDNSYEIGHSESDEPSTDVSYSITDESHKSSVTSETNYSGEIDAPFSLQQLKEKHLEKEPSEKHEPIVPVLKLMKETTSKNELQYQNRNNSNLQEAQNISPENENSLVVENNENKHNDKDENIQPNLSNITLPEEAKAKNKNSSSEDSRKVEGMSKEDFEIANLKNIKGGSSSQEKNKSQEKHRSSQKRRTKRSARDSSKTTSEGGMPEFCQAKESDEEDHGDSRVQTTCVRASPPLGEVVCPKQEPSTSVPAQKEVTPSTSKVDAPENKAFWLIFSGEYTKAMNKDWHSGHFCCWQCDESLTGQRYVLRDEHPYCIKCYESVFANGCEECNKTIGIDSKDLSYKDKHWHEACFLCNKCRVSLVDKQFGSKLDKIFCGNCYDAQFASRCDGCGQIFKAGTKKMEYKTRQWHEPCFACCVCKTPIGTKSFIPREQEIYCATCYEEKFATRCVKCNKIITSGGVTYKNEPWHRECFSCTNCSTTLAGVRFTSRDDKPYCAECFGELFSKRCTACSKPITGIGGTRFISFEDRHWHNDCFMCASCKTSLVGRGFITDAEDIICPECAKQKLM